MIPSDKKIILAPMEGITDFHYRNAAAQHFGGIDEYSSPFISIYPTASMKKREIRDLELSLNTVPFLIPQLMADDADRFTQAARKIAETGYRRIDINLGCPSGTVVSKGRGAGFLKRPDDLDRFLDRSFELLEGSGIEVSVKTRVGFDNPSDAEILARIYSRYPLRRIAVHPRLREDYYREGVRRELFDIFHEICPQPMVWNGDIRTPQDAEKILAEYPKLEGIMIGRGLITNPALARMIRGGKAPERGELRDFHADLMAQYTEEMKDEKGILFRMKEIWSYMGGCFDDSARYVRDICRAQTLVVYKGAVRTLFGSCRLKEE